MASTHAHTRERAQYRPKFFREFEKIQKEIFQKIEFQKIELVSKELTSIMTLAYNTVRGAKLITVYKALYKDISIRYAQIYHFQCHLIFSR